MQGTGEGLSIEEAGVLESEKLKGEKASQWKDEGMSAGIFLHVFLITKV